MTNRFGGSSLGWTRVAMFDVNNCPNGFMTHMDGTIRTCIVSEDNVGCAEIVYSTFKISYTKITGQIRGYQIGTLDGFQDASAYIRSTNISDNYVDGVSLTSDNEHVWTFVTGFGKIGLNAANKFFQYPRVKPYGSIFFEKNFYGRNG